MICNRGALLEERDDRLDVVDVELVRFEQDPNQKDRIYLDIHLKPYFPAKTFMIKLEGQKGDDSEVDWSSKYEQDK